MLAWYMSFLQRVLLGAKHLQRNNEDWPVISDDKVVLLASYLNCLSEAHSTVTIQQSLVTYPDYNILFSFCLLHTISANLTDWKF